MLLKNMQVLEIMKTHVAKTTGEATLAEATDLLDLYQTTGLPVVDSTGVVQGMLTESDILRAAQTSSGAPAASQCVHDWMTAPAICIDENETVEVAARLMLQRGLKRLPVLTEGRQIVGVLNRIDLLQAVFEGAIDDVFTDGS
jgi:CBS domain-containing protein